MFMYSIALPTPAYVYTVGIHESSTIVATDRWTSSYCSPHRDRCSSAPSTIASIDDFRLITTSIRAVGSSVAISVFRNVGSGDDARVLDNSTNLGTGGGWPSSTRLWTCSNRSPCCSNVAVFVDGCELLRQPPNASAIKSAHFTASLQPPRSRGRDRSACSARDHPMG